MPRGRIILRTLGTKSAKFAALTQAGGKRGEFAQALYPLLIVNADDWGRLDGDAWTVKHGIWSTSTRHISDFEAALTAMADVGLVRRAEIDGRWVIQIENFDLPQQGLHKRTPSRFPEVPGTSLLARARGTEGKGREEKGTEEKRTKERAVRQNAPADTTADEQAKPDAVGATWNRICCSLAGVQRLGPERLRHLKARLSEYPSLDWWEHYLSRIEASDFLTGRKPREGQHAQWKATFDWALKPDSIAKVCEGNYDTPTGQARGRTWSEGCQHEPQCTDRRVHDLLLARAQVGE